ncbi:COPPER TRANSPORT PROTEIN FAMILY-RELATED [Salix koriyanagi]|uniref:COPPER TRANSPORT PROTEIN FAMILY-RELATED n=1 Tax=Salix koriyanagi TaxID=2511006 RepID=A0A9Q0TCL3_9ROSI|nr:COPPER TRANSPORT PROTEIN FAMILY-RELATED [Salix koriyanagi]
MSKKTIVSVELLCSKCRKKVMKLIATIEGITSIVLDPSKNTVTVIGEADPVKIICKVRKFRKSASITSIGPPKDEKKDDPNKKDAMKDVKGVVIPYTCQRCDVWYVVNDDFLQLLHHYVTKKSVCCMEYSQCLICFISTSYEPFVAVHQIDRYCGRAIALVVLQNICTIAMLSPICHVTGYVGTCFFYFFL